MKLFIYATSVLKNISGLKISGSLVAKLARLYTSKTTATNNTESLSDLIRSIVRKIFISF
jgi:hypothetical protein